MAVSTQFWGYDQAGDQTLAVDADGNSTVSIYDDGELTTQIVENASHTVVSDVTYGYNTDQQQTSLIDAAGNTTISGYDADGDTTLQLLYNSVGTLMSTESWAYDDSGNVTEQINNDTTVSADGDTTFSYYDGLGDVTQQVVYLGTASPVTLSGAYDAAGNATRQVDIQGYTTLSTYDDGELVTQAIDLGATQVNYQTFAYDSNGNVTSQLDNDGNITSSTYNGEGLLATQTITNGATVLEYETMLYDANGNVTDQIDVIGGQTRETRYSYNGLGQETQEIDGYGSSLSGTINYSYDDNGHLLQEVDATGTNTTQYAYNSMGEVTKEVNAMGGTTTYDYDANGNMTSELDADGRLQMFAYDAMGQETSNVWYSGDTASIAYETESVSFGYDANGNETLAYASNENGYTMAYDMAYNPMNQVTSVIEYNNGTSTTLNFAYDGNGNRTLETDSLGGTVSSIYDADNELVTEIYSQTGGTGMEIQQDYNWLGQVVEQRDYNDPSGTPTLISTSDYGYNAAGSITSLNEFTSASTIASYALSYDAAQELTQQIDHGNTANFAYDVLGELTTYGTATQSYDASGNRASDTVTLGNEVTFDGTYSYAYDPEGNETLMYDASVTWAYTYDNENHMTSATETSTTAGLELQVEYKYNAFGNMTQEMETYWSGGTGTTMGTTYVIDGWNPDKVGSTGSSGTDVIADIDALGGGLISHYVWGDKVGQLFGRYDTSAANDPAAPISR